MATSTFWRRSIMVWFRLWFRSPWHTAVLGFAVVILMLLVFIPDKETASLLAMSPFVGFAGSIGIVAAHAIAGYSPYRTYRNVEELFDALERVKRKDLAKLLEPTLVQEFGIHGVKMALSDAYGKKRAAVVLSEALALIERSP